MSLCSVWVLKHLLNVVCLCFAAIFLCAESSLAEKSYAPGQIILKLDPRNSLLSSIGANPRTKGLEPLFGKHPKKGNVPSKRSYAGLENIFVLRVESGAELEACEAYGRIPGVVYAEPNYCHKPCLIPNDQKFDLQWNLNRIQAGQAWDIDTGNDTVTIAVVDTGLDYTHPDISGNVWGNSGEIPDNGIDDDGNGYIDDVIGWDFVDAFGGASCEDFVTPDNDSMDRHGHGTHVAGILAAMTDNGLGVAGVAWHVRIMPVRAGFKTPSGDGVLESDDAARAIVYAAENGARVINLSWGGSAKSTIIEDAIRFASDQGALVCAAAGNDGASELFYPAALENSSILAVGATDYDDRYAGFSNHGNWVHVSAPGTGILSTCLNGLYCSMSGTSMATPHVTGMAALLFSHFPGWTPTDVKYRTMRSVDILPVLDGRNVTSGRINLLTALSADYSTPHVFSICPASAHEGEVIKVVGDRFGIQQGSGSLIFAPDIQPQVLSWSNNEITCSVPAGAQSGPVTVATVEGTSNPVSFTVLPSSYQETLAASSFIGGGTAQEWRGDDESHMYHLPFSFTFFGEVYDAVYVCTNGYLDFTDSTCAYKNSIEALKSRKIIAPLWDDLITNGVSQAGEDIYIHSPSIDSVSIRWAAELYETSGPVNVEVILYEDGRIRFDYGSGNANLSPTIGISNGDGLNYHLATPDGSKVLDGAQSVLFTPLESQQFLIRLSLGWNLISFPLAPDDVEISHVLGAAKSGTDVVWGFEEGAWQCYVPGNPGLSDLEEMEAGKGYWVKAAQPGLVIQAQGHQDSMPLVLGAGWNLIGFKMLMNMPVEEALKSLQGNYSIVWGYEESVWKCYDPAQPAFSDLSVIESGKGYWIQSQP